MKSISFKNFRRFQKFPEFKFGDITILVGGNNAGKSTLVKALLLVLDNLKTMHRDGFREITSFKDLFNSVNMPEFRFDENKFHELNIKSFHRALNRNCKDDEHLTFNFCIEHPLSKDIYEFEFVISKYNKIGEYSNSNDAARGLVDFFSVKNKTKEIQFDFSFSNKNGEKPYMYVRIMNDAAKEIENKIEVLQQEKADLNQYINDTQSHLSEMSSFEADIIEKLNEKKAQLKKIELILKQTLSNREKAKDVEAKIPFQPTLDQSSKYLILDLINDIIRYAGYSSTEKKGSKAYNAEVKVKQLLTAYRSKMEDVSIDIRNLLDFINVDYIQAHGVTQKTLFSTVDNSDHIAKTVKDFVQSRAWRNDKIRAFIQYWMMMLNIGYDFSICDVEGESYKVLIHETENDKNGFPLADLGIGSIQLMMLLFALATSIKRNIGKIQKNNIVVIEEPEQNLHPAVQSKLADLLFMVYEEFGLKFIIETHSEYLLREIQIIVAKNRLVPLNCNPFRVYYFHKENGPYDMGFQSNGKFIESFGSGFFDVADNAAVELFDYDEE